MPLASYSSKFRISCILLVLCLGARVYILFHFPLSENMARDRTNKGSKQVGYWGQVKRDKVTKIQDC